MNALIVAFFAALAVASAAPSGWGLGWGAPGVVLAAPAAGALISGPVGIAGPLGIGGAVGLAAPGLALGGVGVATRGGGAIGVGPAGLVVKGPPTVPVTIAGPSGAVSASGLWGPTLAGVAGHGW